MFLCQITRKQTPRKGGWGVAGDWANRDWLKVLPTLSAARCTTHMSFTHRVWMCATQFLLYFVIFCHFNGLKPILNGTIRKQTFPNRFGCQCGAISSAVYCPPPYERLPLHRMLSHVYVLHTNCLSVIWMPILSWFSIFSFVSNLFFHAVFG